MLGILVHGFLNCFDTAQSERWEACLAASRNLNQAEYRVRELEANRQTL